MEGRESKQKQQTKKTMFVKTRKRCAGEDRKIKYLEEKHSI